MNGELIDTLKALADPLRLRMLAILGAEELAVGELAQVIGVTQPRVSHHLKMIKEVGLITVRKEGSWTFCRRQSQTEEGPGADLLKAMKPWAKELIPSAEDLARLQEVLDDRRERSRSYFDEAAGRGEKLEPDFRGSGLRHQALSLLLPPNLTLADIGCGAGFMTRALAARAKKVILVDHSPAMLERAQKELGSSLPAELEFRVGELDHLPLAPGEVDGAFVNMVLHHVPDLKKTLAQLSGAIRPGGSLVVSDLLPHHEEWLRDECADLRLGLDPQTLTELAAAVGLTGIVVEKGVDRLLVKSRSGQEKNLPIFVMKTQKEN